MNSQKKPLKKYHSLHPLFAIFLIIFCWSLILSANAKKTSEAFLSIKSGSRIQKFSQQDMLTSLNIKKLTIEHDPAYNNKRRTYSAIPVSQLFKEFKIEPENTIAFSCLDGFSASISAERILNTDPNRAIAYIAIENQLSTV